MDYITAHHSQGHPRPIEAAHLRAMHFTTWWRAREGLVAPPPAQAQLNLLPSIISFGSATAGTAALRRNLLLTSDGNAPSLVEGLRIVSSAADFDIDSPPAWPQVLMPGDSLVVGLTFTPQLPAGFRTQPIEVTANGGRKLTATLRALVQPPPEPLLRAPSGCSSVSSTPGRCGCCRSRSSTTASARSNSRHRNLIPGSTVGILVLDTPGAQSIPAGGAGNVALRFTPPYGGPNQLQA